MPSILLRLNELEAKFLLQLLKKAPKSLMKRDFADNERNLGVYNLGPNKIPCEVIINERERKLYFKELFNLDGTKEIGTIEIQRKLAIELGNVSAAAKNQVSSSKQQEIQQQAKHEFTKRLKTALEKSEHAYSTQKEIANIFGCSQRTVSGWLSGRAAPARRKLPRIAAVLGVNANWLEHGVDK